MSGPAVTLADKVVALTGALSGAGVPHAFGGALALAYYAEPRATADIDLNVFVAPEQATPTLEKLSALGVSIEGATAVVERDGQARVRWDDVPVDLFFAYDRFHEHARGRVRTVPFGEATIPVLAPEDLLVCKAVFDRRKDWIDIEQMLVVVGDELDVADARHWVERFVGPGDHRLEKLDDAVATLLGAGGWHHPRDGT